MRREHFFVTILRHRWLTLGIAAGLVLVAGSGWNDLTIDYGVEQFFLQWGPERNTYDRYKELFPREDTRISLFWQDDRVPGAEMYRDMSRAASWFEAVGLDDIRWLGSVTVADAERIDGEIGVEVGPLVPAHRATDAQITDALRKHRTDRLLNGVMWDSTQTVFLIHGFLRQGENTDTTRRRIDSSLRDSISALKTAQNELVLTGLPIARAQAPELLESDIRLLLAAAFAVFGLVLYWFFRRPAYVLLSIATVAPAYVVVLGILGHVGKPMSILTSFIPIVVLVVGMSDAVHILSEYRTRRRSSSDAREAIASTFGNMVGPCCYTSLTTAVGFASLAATRIGIVVDFGLLTAAAILLTFAFSMTVFPILMSFARDHSPYDQVGDRGWLNSITEFAARRATMPSRTVVGAAAVVAAIAVTLASNLRTNTYLIDDTKPNAPFMQDISWIDDRGFGFFQVNVLLTQTADSPIHSPAALAWMNDLRDFVADEPLVTHVAGPQDFFEHIRSAAVGPDVASLPASDEEASQLLLMAQLHDPGFLEELYIETDGVAQVVITVRDKGSQVLKPFLGRLDAFLSNNPFPVGTAELTGTVTMIHSFTERLLRSFGPSIMMAVVLITAIMVWMFRSVRLGLVALLPNLFPLVVVLGATAALGYGLKPSTILVLSIAFGIAVDDTIHLMSRVARHASGSCQIASGLSAGIRDTGNVMIVTTGLVAAGFFLLTLSHFEVLYLIGLMTALSAVTALLADLFILPSIISLMEARTPLTRPAVTAAGGEI